MNNDSDLNEALGALSRMLPRDAGSAVEERLQKVFRAKRRRLRLAEVFYVALVAILIAGGASFTARRSSHNSAPDSFVSTGFVTLPYGEGDVPIEDAVILRVNLPPLQLSAMGIPLAALPASQRISADVLVGQDGVPRAVRFVQ